MAEGRPSVEALLAVARAEFAHRLPAKTAEIEKLVAEGTWDEARRASHKLRGSAATYGFPALSVAAGAIEDILLAAGGQPDDGARERVMDILRGACVEAERASRAGA
jgi:HPt (histidine-containing phosphotransfer) domain-containing protein